MTRMAVMWGGPLDGQRLEVVGTHLLAGPERVYLNGKRYTIVARYEWEPAQHGDWRGVYIGTYPLWMDRAHVHTMLEPDKEAP